MRRHDGLKQAERRVILQRASDLTWLRAKQGGVRPFQQAGHEIEWRLPQRHIDERYRDQNDQTIRDKRNDETRRHPYADAFRFGSKKNLPAEEYSDTYRNENGSLGRLQAEER